MKKKFMQITAAAILGFSMFVAITQLPVSGQNNERGERGREHSIEGVWQTSVTQRNCQTGDPVAPAFPGLLAFHQGGTLTGTSTAVSSAYAVWQREGRRRYSFAFISLRYSPAGVFIGTQKVRQTVELSANGDEFTSTGTVEILDTNGNTIGTGCATSTGTRFE